MCTRNTFEAIKDIASGQELFVRYGSVDWFESKKLSYADVDYANTMWRPDLLPMPIRQKVVQTTGADGRNSFSVLKAVQLGTVLEISPCVEVSIIVVDQFPYLWDFVLTGETEYMLAPCYRQTSAHSRARIACFIGRSSRRKYRRAS